MLRAPAILFALTFAASAAIAGPSEDTKLSRLVGVWTGTGDLTGTETGELSCLLTIRQRKDGVGYTTKCQVPKYGRQSFSGVISYNDAKGRYEAKSPSGDITVGETSGNAIVFNAKMKGLAVGTSVMRLTPSKVTVDTSVKRSGGDGQITTHIEMRR